MMNRRTDRRRLFLVSALAQVLVVGALLGHEQARSLTRDFNRCLDCHIEVEKTHPGKYLTHHPPGSFSCTACHEGQEDAAKVKSAHGTVRRTVKPFSALDDPEYVERPFLTWDSVQSACLKCHEEVRGLAGAPLLARGAQLFNYRPCFGCHVAADLGEERKPGPDLTNIGAKTDRQWIVGWLKNPRSWLANARMPDFLLSDQEANAIADYLLSLNETKLPGVAWEPHLLKPSDELTDEEYDKADLIYEQGRAIWREARCSACHNVVDVVGAFEVGPDLNRVAGKVNRDWVYWWLRDPRLHYPGGLMPRFRLSDEDIKALVYYMMTDDHFNEEEPENQRPKLRHPPSAIRHPPSAIIQGKQLVIYYGCAGCHAIKGHEEDLKIGPDLTGVSGKSLKHFNFKDLRFDRETWLKTKLTNPRFFKTPQRNMRMPDFQFSEPDVTALTTLLLGLTDGKVPGELKVGKPPRFQPTGEFARLLDELKCTTCHMIRGSGGGFAPDLSWEGMPTLGLTDNEIRVIVDFIFAELVTDTIPKGFLEREAPTEAQIEEGRAIYQRKGCFACHQIGSEGGAIGPELTAAGDRLQPGYIFALLKNPQAFDRHMVMPRYGFSDAEATALTRFLLTRKRKEGDKP